MAKLNVIARKYLDANGISVVHFANCIGCDRTRCSHWLSGKEKLSAGHIKKVHDFLAGQYIKTVDQLMKEE